VLRYGWLIVVLLVSSSGLFAQEPIPDPGVPRIAIIIDDLGNRRKLGERAVALPGNVTLNILPFTPYAKHLASLARQTNKELMLHIPMEAMNARYPGEGGLYTSMDREQFNQTIDVNLSYVKGIKGVSNHMGSRLTQDGRMMGWFMSRLANYKNLYFVDSRTTKMSIAPDYARDNQISHTARDVFLDHIKTPKRMLKQWKYLIRLAKKEGSALAIGHPYPLTVKFLEQQLPDIELEAVKLVSVSELIRWRKTRRKYAWQTSLSPSHKAAKN